MKFIKKLNEPIEWRNYRLRIQSDRLKKNEAVKKEDFDNAPADARKALKDSLLKEQGHLCCYCMAPIFYNSMKVEHWKPRNYSNLILDYKNLFGACKGNSCPENHCDTKKADSEIVINPTDKINNCEKIIGYKLNGTLIYPDKYQKDIAETLNLNNPVLVINRKSAIEATLLVLKKKDFKKAYIAKQYQNIITTNDTGKFSPYCNVILWLLSKKIAAN